MKYSLKVVHNNECVPTKIVETDNLEIVTKDAACMMNNDSSIVGVYIQKVEE